MLTWPQIITKARSRSGYTDSNFPRDGQWMDFLTIGVKSVWQFVMQHQPRALPVSTVMLDTVHDQFQYDLPYDFAGAVDVEWNEAIWGAPVPILPVHRRHPLIFPSRKTFLNTSHWKYEIHKKPGAVPERYQIAIYPRPTSDIPNIIGANKIVVSYVPRPLEQHFGIAQAATVNTLTFATDANLVGTLIQVPDYYRNSSVWIYDAATGKFQANTIASYVPLTRVATMVSAWSPVPTATPEIPIRYGTVPTVPEQWMDAVILEAIIQAIMKDDDWAGKLAPTQQLLALEWRKLKNALDLAYPRGPQLMHDVEDLV